MTEISVIIVNFNGGEDILRCLRSLDHVRQSEPVFEVIVVDNGSTDSSPDQIESGFPSVKLVSAGRNLGFAAACNRGMREAIGNHILLLNPDTEVTDGALRSMSDALKRNPLWGIVGARMVNNRGEAYRAARRFPRPTYLFGEQLHLPRALPSLRTFSGYFYCERNPTELDEVDQVEGSALMISGQARQQVGDLDERFFVFFEEVDWCRRVKAAGFEIHVVQDAVITHHMATTMSKFFVESRRYNARSACEYFLKYEGEAGLKRLVRWMVAALWIRQIAAQIALYFRTSDDLRLKLAAARAEREIYREMRGKLR